MTTETIAIGTPESIPLVDRNEEFLLSFSNAFREAFNNEPYGQCVYFPTLKKCLSIQKIMGLKPKNYVYLKDHDFPTTIQKAEAVVEDSENKFHKGFWWHDPDKTHQVFGEKLMRLDSYVTVVRDATGSVLAGTCGYESSLEEAFGNDALPGLEEWKNPYLYSGLALNTKDKRDLSEFILALNKFYQDEAFEFLPFTAQTKVFICNCIFVNPTLRKGLPFLQEVIRTFYASLPDHIRALPFIAELIRGDSGYNLLRVGGLDESGYELAPGHIIGINHRTDKTLDNILVPMRQFVVKLRQVLNKNEE